MAPLYLDAGSSNGLVLRRPGFARFKMYAEQALQIIRVDEVTGEVHVQPHWVGIAPIRAFDKRTLRIIAQDNKPFQRTILPVDGAKIILHRDGLPAVPMSRFAAAKPNNSPLWQDWLRRQATNSEPLAWPTNVVAWELGNGHLGKLETSARVEDELGNEGEIILEWHQPPYTSFEIEIRARVRDASLEPTQTAVDYLQSLVPAETWQTFFSGYLWFRSLEFVSHTEDQNTAFRFRVHLSQPYNPNFLCSTFADALIQLLIQSGSSAPDFPLALVTRTKQLDSTGTVRSDGSRQWRCWPPEQEPELAVGDMSMEPALRKRLETIRHKLVLLDNLDSPREIFGTETHRYTLRPTLNERVLRHFEKKHGILLPPEYRGFLLMIGDGHVGPGHGLSSLEEARDQAQGKPNEPFPFTSADHIEDWEILDAEEAMAEFVAPDDFDEYPSSSHGIDGTLYLGTYGCAIGILLVVNGDEYGRIWIDDLANDGGIQPARQNPEDKTAVSFLDWYEEWLDHSVNSARERKT